MIEIAKVEAAEGVIHAGEKESIDQINAQMLDMKDKGQQLCTTMVNSLRPDGQWTAWCNANMSDAEKAWYIARYQDVTTFIAGVDSYLG